MGSQKLRPTTLYKLDALAHVKDPRPAIATRIRTLDRLQVWATVAKCDLLLPERSLSIYVHDRAHRDIRRIGYLHLPLKTAADFGSLIRSPRKARGLGQAELAEMVGVSRRWLNQVGAGKPGASLSLVLNTLKALDVQIEVRADEESASPEGIAPVLGPDIDDILGDYTQRRSDG